MNYGKRSLVPLLVAALIMLSACGGGNGGSSSSGGSSGGNNPPPPANTNIVYTFSGGNPTAIATQIGTGSWTAGTAPTNNQFTVSIPSGTTNYGLAYFCPGISGQFSNQEIVVEAAVSDGAAFTVGCNPSASSLGSARVLVSVPNIGFGLMNALYIDGAQGTSTDASFGQIMATIPFTLNAPIGTGDVAVLGADSFNALALRIFRNQTVPGDVNGGVRVTFDSTDAIGWQSYVVHDAPSGWTTGISSTYVTAEGTAIFLLGSNGTQYPIAPASQVQSGDFYQLWAAAGQENQQGQSQEVFQYVNSASPLANFKLPPPLTYNAPAAAAWPSFTVSYSGFSGVTASDTNVYIQWSPTEGTYDYVSVTATSAFLNGATTLAIPDLSSLTGFLQAPSGKEVEWSEEVTGGDYHYFIVTPSTGSIQAAWSGGSYAAP
jgi:hypothetical protein